MIRPHDHPAAMRHQKAHEADQSRLRHQTSHQERIQHQVKRILIHGVDIPLGVSLSMIGAPVFLGMLIRRSYHFGGEGA